jgi:hypothetical protein
MAKTQQTQETVIRCLYVLVLPFLAVTFKVTEQVPFLIVRTDKPDTLQAFFEAVDIDKTIFFADFREIPSSRAIRELDAVGPFRKVKTFAGDFCGTVVAVRLIRAGVEASESEVVNEPPLTTNVNCGLGAE